VPGRPAAGGESGRPIDITATIARMATETPAAMTAELLGCRANRLAPPVCRRG